MIWVSSVGIDYGTSDKCDIYDYHGEEDPVIWKIGCDNFEWREAVISASAGSIVVFIIFLLYAMATWAFLLIACIQNNGQGNE